MYEKCDKNEVNSSKVEAESTFGKTMKQNEKYYLFCGYLPLASWLSSVSILVIFR